MAGNVEQGWASISTITSREIQTAVRQLLPAPRWSPRTPGVSFKTMLIMHLFVNDMFKRIAAEASKLAHYNKR